MRRRPPFALVLVASIALFVGALWLIVGGGAGGRSDGTVSVPGLGPARACVATHAAAEATVRSAVKADGSATVPLSVTEHATVGGTTVSAHLSEAVSEAAVITRPVLVRRGAIASARACARGESPVAARGTALGRAYKTALAKARARALALAKSTVRRLVPQLTPAAVAAAHAAALSRARAAAAAARPALAQRALSEARARARAA